MRRRTGHLVAGLVAVLLGPLLAAGAFAPAAYAAAGPTSLSIEGPGLAKPRNVVAATDPKLFADLYAEVSWLATRSANAPQPDPAVLGPAYPMVIRVDAVPDQSYVLYPLAVGGPRVFRPAEQPNNRRVAAAWFYGRLSMPETMRAAGVPLPLPDGGGRGGGGPVGAEVTSHAASDTTLGELVGQWQRQVLLLGGGALVLLVLLGGFVRLVRRS